MDVDEAPSVAVAPPVFPDEKSLRVPMEALPAKDVTIKQFVLILRV